MAISFGYCTLAEAKARLGISDSNDDTIIENVIEAVSRLFDNWTHRRFYAVTETRTYTAVDNSELIVDDLLSVTTLKTDAAGARTYTTTWATTDYDLGPQNANLDGRPYTLVTVTPQGRYRFPALSRGVQIAGSFGYASTTPDSVNEACLIQTERIFRRKDSPFGVAGAAEFGQLRLLSRLDPDVEIMLAPYRHLLVG